MDEWVANQELVDRLKDLQRGLHAAMTALIGNKNKEETELILRQMDHHMTVTINNIKTVSKK